VTAATPVDRLREAAEAVLATPSFAVYPPTGQALATAVLALLDAAEVGGCGCARCNATLDGIVSAAAAVLPEEWP
jgi:hypothetical protein